MDSLTRWRGALYAVQVYMRPIQYSTGTVLYLDYQYTCMYCTIALAIFFRKVLAIPGLDIYKQHICTVFISNQITKFKMGIATRFKVGIAIHQSKALFKGYCRPSSNFNFTKGTFYNLKKKIQRQNGSAILDGLHNSRCGSFHCVCIILDDAIICMDKNTKISSLFTFWAA